MRRAHCSSPVTYKQDGDVVTVNATIGKTDYSIATEGGAIVGAHSVDYLISAADLPFEPEVGDRIESGDSRYEVMPLGDDIKGWRWSDSGHATYRIHTRLTDG